jgi:hypothetical protein
MFSFFSPEMRRDPKRSATRRTRKVTPAHDEGCAHADDRCRRFRLTAGWVSHLVRVFSSAPVDVDGWLCC